MSIPRNTTSSNLPYFRAPHPMRLSPHRQFASAHITLANSLSQTFLLLAKSQDTSATNLRPAHDSPVTLARSNFPILKRTGGTSAFSVRHSLETNEPRKSPHTFRPR